MAGEGTVVSGVAGRYASALFDLAKEKKKITKVEKELKAFSKLLAGDKNLRRLVSSPVFSAKEQQNAIEAILAKAGVKDITANFLALLAKNRRLFFYEKIAKAFHMLVADDRGEISSHVVSSKALTQAQVTKLKKELKAIAGRDVNLTQEVDPSILGGLIIQLGSTQFDNSLKSKLQSMKKSMKEVG